MTIPCEIVDESPMGELSKAGEGFKAKTYRVLFKAPEAVLLAVDDNEMNLTVIKELLRETEMTVDTAGGGLEALELTRRKKFRSLRKFATKLFSIRFGRLKNFPRR